MNFLRLSHSYYSTVVNSSVDIVDSPFDGTWLLAVNKTLEVVVNMSRSFDADYNQPSYKFQRKTYVPSDTLSQFGLGPPSKACGLVRSPFRAPPPPTLSYSLPRALLLFSLLTLRQVRVMMPQICR
jgi:meiotically up-regulated gene 157 (Mug157) protein